MVGETFKMTYYVPKRTGNTCSDTVADKLRKNVLSNETKLSIKSLNVKLIVETMELKPDMSPSVSGCVIDGPVLCLFDR